MNKYMFERMNCFLEYDYSYSLYSVIEVRNVNGFNNYCSYLKDKNQGWIYTNCLYSQKIAEMDLLERIQKDQSYYILFYVLDACKHEVLMEECDFQVRIY